MSSHGMRHGTRGEKKAEQKNKVTELSKRICGCFSFVHQETKLTTTQK